MTKERWIEIRDQIEIGDPLKDINCDMWELIQYIHELRKRLNLDKDQP